MRLHFYIPPVEIRKTTRKHEKKKTCRTWMWIKHVLKRRSKLGMNKIEYVTMTAQLNDVLCLPDRRRCRRTRRVAPPATAWTRKWTIRSWCSRWPNTWAIANVPAITLSTVQTTPLAYRSVDLFFDTHVLFILCFRHFNWKSCIAENLFSTDTWLY